jgi:CHAD domain-containing protein
MNLYLESKNVDVDSSYCRFGAEALVKLIQTIESQINGVEKSEDIEYVHKMRVTSRRIRAAMPLFKDCFTKKCYKEWRNEIKKVTQFLGAARDLDVQIEFVKDYIKHLKPTEPKKGMDELLQGNIKQRTCLQST